MLYKKLDINSPSSASGGKVPKEKHSPREWKESRRKWCGSNKVFFTSKKRKISYGYYVALFLPAVVATIIRWSLSIYNMWYSLNTWREYTEFIFKITWFTPLLFVIANWFWYLLYWNPMSDNNKLLDSFRKWDKKNRLVVTYVSRWQNDVVLRRAIAQSKKVLKRSSVNYVIEAITDSTGKWTA